MCESLYGIPPEQVIGTALETQYTTITSRTRAYLIADSQDPVERRLLRKAGRHLPFHRPSLPRLRSATQLAINRCWNTRSSGVGSTLMMIVLHDDAEREYAYGPAQGLSRTKVGTFTQALYDEAKAKGWFVISMKNDWKQIFAWEK